jgi:hypothetical protein
MASYYVQQQSRFCAVDASGNWQLFLLDAGLACSARKSGATAGPRFTSVLCLCTCMQHSASLNNLQAEIVFTTLSSSCQTCDMHIQHCYIWQ